MRRDQLPPHKTATFVMPRWRAMYVSVNKAACTSLKWLVADLQGEDRERFYRSMSREVSRTMTIHRRALWRSTPMAALLPDSELADIAPDNGWFVFAAVRHPTARLFSAWQSKLLLREPWWADQFGDEPWFPRMPESSDDIVEEFLRFVRAVGERPEQRIMQNRHFAPQYWMLAADRMPYSRVYKTSEIPQLLDDFERHLRARGFGGGALTLPRTNETPLKPIAPLFTPEVIDVAGRVYRDDLEAFGYDDVMPGGVDPADRYPDAVLAEIGRLIERAERINDLALRARAAKQRADRSQRRAAAPAPPRPEHADAGRGPSRNGGPPRAPMRYLEFLERLHAVLEPAGYLEIGVRHGDSLALARCPAIGVDPQFELRHALPPTTTVVRASSDEFFTRRNPLKPLDGHPVDLSFIDGMHLAEFALRDFANVERRARWTSVVVFDDMLPRRPKIAARDRRTRRWTGDVYKLLGVLAQHRRDLVTLRVDTEPTGLLLVLGLDPRSRVLDHRYDEIVRDLVVPDPQEVPPDVLERRGALDPHAVLGADLWPWLREARAAGTAREDGQRELRRAVRRDFSRGPLRRLVPALR
jgi:hypothetical protein